MVAKETIAKVLFPSRSVYGALGVQGRVVIVRIPSRSIIDAA